jgi:hypothetical protein
MGLRGIVDDRHQRSARALRLRGSRAQRFGEGW